MQTDSDSMNDMPTCPECGRPLPKRSPDELCPVCLLKQGLGTRVDSQLATKTGDSPDSSRLNRAPSVAEIQSAFPNLEIVELLGQGGMGVVYKARQPQLDRFVALKILPDQAQKDPAFSERFAREARALARLNHPNIVAVYDFGQAGGHFFLTMEYVDGMTLRQLEKSQKVTPEEALVITPLICDALQYAHDEGIVHRDIKPGNILIDTKGRVKIADFGLAKLLKQEADDFQLTGEEAVMGTPHYMAPEQMTGARSVDHRADIYSLGVVIYEMLTGELPVGRFSAPSKKAKIDVRLDEVVLKALESDPELRYQRVNEVKSEIDSISGHIDALPPHLRRMLGFDFKSKRTLFGLPLLHITTQVDPVTGKAKEAKGVFAMGAKATGIFALGGVSRGIVSCGGIAIGVFPVGGISLGLLSFGGVSLALVLSTGGISLAPIAVGGLVIGLWAFGGGGYSLFSVTGPEATPFATWLQENYFNTSLPVVLMILANLCWVLPFLIMLYFQRKHAKGELD